MVASRTGAAALMILGAAGSAQAATRLSTQCQKNEGDGRILMVDGTSLPPNARFKVLSYRATRHDGDWSYGPCVLNVTSGR